MRRVKQGTTYTIGASEDVYDVEGARSSDA
ncbi:hypothetical protein NC651_036848 [Populus alba x Populus x berolinensis]|nr:hypothetical protein NC651_036848 [Populus alba x Populus x berolinensis]